jgi:restriction system protein
VVSVLENGTPDEAIERAYQNVKRDLADKLLEQIKECSPGFFESLVVDLLKKMGYGSFREDAGQVTGRPSDEGIDGVINEDRLGLDVIYLQAKRWDGSVGRPEIQKFVGALTGKRAKKGVFITTSRFTEDARAYANLLDLKVVLIDGEHLAEHMIDFNVGVTTYATYQLKRVDLDYFIEE